MSKLKYYYNLDGIRGIAALMVVFFHFFTYPNSEYVENLNFYQKITEFGQHGVSLFFVLSGFVITRILINKRGNNNYFGDFFKRRILRILPLYYLFLFFYYGITALLNGGGLIELSLQLPFYFYIQNFTEVLGIDASGPGHYWSLAVEEHFYLLWPLFVYFIKPKFLGRFIALSILLVLLLKYNMISKGLSINTFTFTRIDQILIGAYLSILELKEFFKQKNSLNKMIILGISILPIAMFIYFTSNLFPLLKEITKYLLLGAFFFSLIGGLMSLREDHVINKVLKRKVLQYLGKISYGIYVWHILALILLDYFIITKLIIIDLVFTIALTILMAHISYFYFEKYFLKLKDQKLPLKFKSSYQQIN